jgi:hypothetical protein
MIKIYDTIMIYIERTMKGWNEIKEYIWICMHNNAKT